MHLYRKIIEKNLKQETKLSFENFLKQVKDQFGMKVIFDLQICSVILQILQQSFKNSSYNSNFDTMIQIFRKFAQMILSNNFISFQAYQNMIRSIQKYEKSIHKKIWKILLSLDRCQTQQDFQEQFKRLLKQTECNNEQNLQKCYFKFWNQLDYNQNLNPKSLSKLYSYFLKFEEGFLFQRSVIQKIQKYTQKLGCTDNQVNINQKLKNIAKKNSLKQNPQIQQQLEREENEIVNTLKKFVKQECVIDLGIELRLCRFGSLVNGFSSKNTDLDLTILTNSFVCQKQLLQLLKDFFKQLYRNASIYLIQPKNSPRLLVINLKKFQPQCHIDLVINNCLGVINSRFLSVYSQIEWIKQLGILIKMWGKKYKVIQQQRLSSYALIIMLIYYLLNIGKVKLILDVTKIPPQQRPNFRYKRINGFNKEQQFNVHCNFKIKPQDVTFHKKENIYELLIGFFYYYSLKQVHNNIISVNGDNSGFINPQCVFTIKDPFDQLHNPGRAKFNQSNYIFSQFKQAYIKFNQQNIQSFQNFFSNN